MTKCSEVSGGIKIDEITRLHIENMKEDLANLEKRLDRMIRTLTLLLSGVIFPVLVGAILIGIEAITGR